MTTAVAFLRAINVTGRFIRMADLASHCSALGLADVSTFLNSGNVVFRTRVQRLDRLQAEIERGLEPRLGFRSEVFLRSSAELHELAGQAESLRESVHPDGDVNVAFVNEPLSSAQVAALEALRSDVDQFVLRPREVIWICTRRQSESKFSNALFERRLGLRSTLRRGTMLWRLSEQLRQSGLS